MGRRQPQKDAAEHHAIYLHQILDLKLSSAAADLVEHGPEWHPALQCGLHRAKPPVVFLAFAIAYFSNQNLEDPCSQRY